MHKCNYILLASIKIQFEIPVLVTVQMRLHVVLPFMKISVQSILNQALPIRRNQLGVYHSL